MTDVKELMKPEVQPSLRKAPRASRKLWWIGGLIALIGAGLIAFIVATIGSDDEPASASAGAAPTQYQEMPHRPGSGILEHDGQPAATPRAPIPAHRPGSGILEHDGQPASATAEAPEYRRVGGGILE